MTHEQQSQTEIAYRVVLHYAQLQDLDTTNSIESAIIGLLADLHLLCDEYGVEAES